MTTIADVARRAGVGVGTVSRVLNDRPNVDPGTRARVLAAIDELDYAPSSSARRLSLGRTQTIGVVVPFLTRPSVVERLRGIEGALVRHGLDMVVFNVETAERRDVVLEEHASRRRVDGLILVSIAPHETELDRLRRSRLPVILIDAHHRRLPRVVVDDVGGGGLAARHLIELGHTRMGFVGDIPVPGFGFASSRLRLRGAERALREVGLAIPADRIRMGMHSRQVARFHAEWLLDQPQRPTAIFAASDTEALGVLEAAERAGLAVPRDLSVIGYDDIEAADYSGLTTIHQPLEETGERGVELLIGMIEGGQPKPLREVLDVHLVVRRTTAAAAA